MSQQCFLKIVFDNIELGDQNKNDDLVCYFSLNKHLVSTISLSNENSCSLPIMKFEGILKLIIKTIDDDQLIGSISFDLEGLYNNIEKNKICKTWF